MPKRKKKKEETEVKVGVKSYTIERHKRIWDSLFYSHQKLDTLLITISGAGIYVCLETIKFYSPNPSSTPVLIKLAACILLFAIILNFISQKISSKVHSNDYTIIDIDFTCQEDGLDKTEYTEKINKLECKILILEKINNIFSNLSILLMAAGLTIIVIFFTFIF